jgi:hypothetical protein
MLEPKIVDYTDDLGKRTKVLLPKDVPLSEAYKGIPMGVDFSEIYPEPFASDLQNALFDRNIITIDDFKRAGIQNEIRKAIQQVIKADANKTVDFILKRGIYK